MKKILLIEDDSNYIWHIKNFLQRKGYHVLVAFTVSQGTLFYDTETGRYDIRFDLESFYGGLHCGECFDVKVKDIWIPVRIEMGDDWYLVGLNVSRLDGLRVRM